MSGGPCGVGSDSVVEVEFTLQNGAFPFVRVTEGDACIFDLAAMLPRPDGRYAEFFDVSGADPDRVQAVAADHDAVDVTLLREYEDGGLFEFLVTAECPAAKLAELGALPRTVEGFDGEGRILAEIPPRYDPAEIIGAFLEHHPEASLGSKRERETITPPFTRPAFREALYERLTDRQRQVLRTAFEAGYYEWPRQATGEEVAAELGISSATFSEHVHAAERRLLTAAFDGLSSDRPHRP